MTARAWSYDEETELRALWGDGVVTAKIAARFGRSRNAVIGKANRMGLAPRPSPIKSKRNQNHDPN